MKMQAKKVEVQEIEATGLLSLIGKRVLLLCSNYFYEGFLEGVDDTEVLLTDAGIVYETGEWGSDSWKDRQSLPTNLFVKTQAIESYCLSKKSS
jgi:hypothetical protein